MDSGQAIGVDVAIRRVDPGDTKALDEFLDLTEEYFREDWPEELAIRNWRERYRDRLLERLRKDPRRWLWMAYAGPELVGLAHFNVTGPDGDGLGTIKDIYVRAAHRNKKVGSRMLELVLEELRKAGARRIKASVQVDELGRQRFLEQAGFRVERLYMALDIE